MIYNLYDNIQDDLIDSNINLNKLKRFNHNNYIISSTNSSNFKTISIKLFDKIQSYMRIDQIVQYYYLKYKLRLLSVLIKIFIQIFIDYFY